MSGKILPTHPERRATVYLRQSTLKQVHEHRESTARQYALKQRALDLGWRPDRIDVIDDDLGQSGSSAAWRGGFQRLAADVAHGRMGAIFALEVSRLSRSSADWHRLLELCGFANVVIVAEQAVYTPGDHNDRLLLGLKGTMSEAEQYWMRPRLEGGRMNKARRGERPNACSQVYIHDCMLLQDAAWRASREVWHASCLGSDGAWPGLVYIPARATLRPSPTTPRTFLSPSVTRIPSEGPSAIARGDKTTFVSRCAATSAMRRPRHDWQNPRPLHENATRWSSAQLEHRTRQNP
jgi:DNA invertase Pin-like site-specific DNA recombinase